MPWHVARSNDCPASRPWAVIKNADGSIVACHLTENDANNQLKALNASENNASARLLNVQQIMDFFGVRSRTTIRNWLEDGRLPPPVKKWGSPRWRFDQIQASLDTNTKISSQK